MPNSDQLFKAYATFFDVIRDGIERGMYLESPDARFWKMEKEEQFDLIRGMARFCCR